MPSESDSQALGGIVATLSELCEMLEGLKGKEPIKNVPLDLSTLETTAEPVEPPQTPNHPEWWDPELDEQNDGSGWGQVLPLHSKSPELVFLPMLLQHSWIPTRGNPESYIRSFRGLSFISQSSLYPNGNPIGLPSGLQARRLLLALVSQSVIQDSRHIDVSSMRDLLRLTRMKNNGPANKKLQKTLFKLATTNVSIWFSPTKTKAQIFKGVMFDHLSIDLYPEQEKFAFIPEQVSFSKDFYESVIQGKAMPFIADQVMKARSPLIHDILLWLLHRQAVISKPLFLGYGLMFHQFGQANQKFPKFKFEFRKAIRNIVKNFDREIEIKDKGIVLHRMPFQVPSKKMGW